MKSLVILASLAVVACADTISDAACKNQSALAVQTCIVNRTINQDYEKIKKGVEIINKCMSQAGVSGIYNLTTPQQFMAKFRSLPQPKAFVDCLHDTKQGDKISCLGKSNITDIFHNGTFMSHDLATEKTISEKALVVSKQNKTAADLLTACVMKNLTAILAHPNPSPIQNHIQPVQSGVQHSIPTFPTGPQNTVLHVQGTNSVQPAPGNLLVNPSNTAPLQHGLSSNVQAVRPTFPFNNTIVSACMEKHISTTCKH